VSQSGCLGGEVFKDVVHKQVHDAHGLAGDTSVRVNFFLWRFLSHGALPPFLRTPAFLFALIFIFWGFFTSFWYVIYFVSWNEREYFLQGKLVCSVEILKFAVGVHSFPERLTVGQTC
jgi:hypothetical protein